MNVRMSVKMLGATTLLSVALGTSVRGAPPIWGAPFALVRIVNGSSVPVARAYVMPAGMGKQGFLETGPVPVSAVREWAFPACPPMYANHVRLVVCWTDDRWAQLIYPYAPDHAAGQITWVNIVAGQSRDNHTAMAVIHFADGSFLARQFFPVMKGCRVEKPPTPPKPKPAPPGAAPGMHAPGVLADGGQQTGGHDSYPFVNIKLKNNSNKEVKTVRVTGEVEGHDPQVHHDPVAEPSFVPIPGPSDLRESLPNGQYAANTVAVVITLAGAAGAADFEIKGESMPLSNDACRIQSVEITIDNDGNFARGRVTLQLDTSVQGNGGEPLDCRGDPFDIVKPP